MKFSYNTDATQYPGVMPPSKQDEEHRKCILADGIFMQLCPIIRNKFSGQGRSGVALFFFFKNSYIVRFFPYCAKNSTPEKNHMRFIFWNEGQKKMDIKAKEANRDTKARIAKFTLLISFANDILRTPCQYISIAIMLIILEIQREFSFAPWHISKAGIGTYDLLPTWLILCCINVPLSVQMVLDLRSLTGACL